MTQDLYAIAKQLDETAQGISYHGNALDVARGLPCVTANDVQCLNKWLHGTNTASDGFRLQEIAGYVREYAITQAAQQNETWLAWVDGNEAEALEFTAPADAITFDVAQAGADALGIDICETLNVKRK